MTNDHSMKDQQENIKKAARPRVRHDYELDDDRRMRDETRRKILMTNPQAIRAVNRHREPAKIGGCLAVALLGAVLAAGAVFALWLDKVLNEGGPVL